MINELAETDYNHEFRLTGHRVDLRYVQESDAAFVYTLRSDATLSQHLSSVPSDIESQRTWIASYKTDEARGRQHYFVVERKDHMPCGLVRLYNVQQDRFSWGSVILGANKPHKAALETALLSFGYGFDVLECPNAILDVRRGNARAIAFYQRFGMKQTGEDPLNLYFELSRKAFDAQRDALQRSVLAD